MKSFPIYHVIKRCLDFGISLTLGLLLFPVILVVAIAIKVTSKGPVLFTSNRVGRNNKLFNMPKFRSMQINTPAVATHLLENPDSHLSPIGGFLRKSSLDEIPQLWSVIVGDMSLIGPRPALYNQQELIDMRTEHGIHEIQPGVTGWAQINGRDELSIAEKVAFDIEYLERKGLLLDFKILLSTILVVLKRKSVSH